MRLVYWIWCFPQMFVALILRIFLKVKSTMSNGYLTYYYCNLKCGSISLGNKIFLCKAHYDNPYVQLHEYGHCKQSLILGPLYLILIGLPSLMWAWWGYRLMKNKVNYYWFYTENWANRLGGLEQ